MKKYFEIKKLIQSYGFLRIFEAAVAEIHRKVWREFINNSFSQNSEDLIIEKLFEKDYVGKYLEIGAYHPKRLSNTYRFYKKGWRGNIVEPNPAIKKTFNRYRPDDKFFGVGISNNNKILDYYQFLIPSLNTFLKSDAEKSKKEGHILIKISKIKTKKIEEVLMNKIDFLSIDTEGFDEMILKNWPWKRVKPKVICVEDGRKRIQKIMKDQGYSLYRTTRYNSIFLLKN